MYRIRVRINGKWITHCNYHTREDALTEYRSMAIVPRMFIGPKGIENKQYTDNGYQWKG